MLTNNSAGVMLSGTFGGNGAGLTNVSYLTGVGRTGVNSDGDKAFSPLVAGTAPSVHCRSEQTVRQGGNSLAISLQTAPLMDEFTLHLPVVRAGSDSLAFGINHSNGGADGEYAWCRPRFACFDTTAMTSGPRSPMQTFQPQSRSATGLPRSTVLQRL